MVDKERLLKKLTRSLAGCSSGHRGVGAIAWKVDAASLESHFRSSQDLTPKRREVYLKDGLSVEQPDEANEILLPQGELVDKAGASQIISASTRMLKT